MDYHKHAFEKYLLETTNEKQFGSIKKARISYNLLLFSHFRLCNNK